MAWMSTSLLIGMSWTANRSLVEALKGEDTSNLRSIKV